MGIQGERGILSALCSYPAHDHTTTDSRRFILQPEFCHASLVLQSGLSLVTLHPFQLALCPFDMNPSFIDQPLLSGHIWHCTCVLRVLCMPHATLLPRVPGCCCRGCCLESRMWEQEHLCFRCHRSWSCLPQSQGCTVLTSALYPSYCDHTRSLELGFQLLQVQWDTTDFM